jgi:hypothetical protein
MIKKIRYFIGYLMWSEYGLRLRRVVRRAWCKKYEFWEETSIFDPEGVWQGLDYKVSRVVAMIPFWVKDIDEYRDNAEPELIYY